MKLKRIKFLLKYAIDTVRNPQNSNAIMAIFTILLFSATAAYTGIALLQWAAMRKSNEINRQSLVSIQRAFAVATGIEVTKRANFKGEITGLEFTIKLENAGVTPTRFMTTHHSFMFFPTPLTDTYNFPDVWDESEPHLTVRATMGPKGVASMSPSVVSADVIQDVMNRKKFLYFWGWIKYHDIFPDTPEHLTRYCIQVTGFEGEVLVQNSPMKVLSSNCFQTHSNCYDEECTQY
jgi:hypothetical protein